MFHNIIIRNVTFAQDDTQCLTKCKIVFRRLSFDFLAKLLFDMREHSAAGELEADVQPGTV